MGDERSAQMQDFLEQASAALDACPWLKQSFASMDWKNALARSQTPSRPIELPISDTICVALPRNEIAYHTNGDLSVGLDVWLKGLQASDAAECQSVRQRLADARAWSKNVRWKIEVRVRVEEKKTSHDGELGVIGRLMPSSFASKSVTGAFCAKSVCLRFSR